MWNTALNHHSDQATACIRRGAVDCRAQIIVLLLHGGGEVQDLLSVSMPLGSAWEPELFLPRSNKLSIAVQIRTGRRGSIAKTTVLVFGDQSLLLPSAHQSTTKCIPRSGTGAAKHALISLPYLNVCSILGLPPG